MLWLCSRLVPHGFRPGGVPGILKLILARALRLWRTDTSSLQGANL